MSHGGVSDVDISNHNQPCTTFSVGCPQVNSPPAIYNDIYIYIYISYTFV